jgi:hypothetical protein
MIFTMSQIGRSECIHFSRVGPKESQASLLETLRADLERISMRKGWTGIRQWGKEADMLRDESLMD